MRLVRAVHKWMGLVIGLQVLVWVVSGMVISLLDTNLVKGNVTRAAHPPKAPLVVASGLLPLTEITERISSPIFKISLERALKTPIYRITTKEGSKTFNAVTGERFVLTKEQAEMRARASYQGDGALTSVRFLATGSEEAGGSPLWRADFDDAYHTRVYINAQDGSIAAHRNGYWKIVDVLLMLHFMDYTRTQGFNSPWIIATAFLTLWLTLSGLLLVTSTFSKRDFTRRGMAR